MGRRSDIRLKRDGVMNDPPRRWYAILSATLMFSLALAFYLSQGQRLSGPSYQGVQQTGGGAFWGVILLMGGLVTIAAVMRNSMRHTCRALAFSGLIFLVLCGTFVYSAFTVATANLVAPVVCGFFSFGHFDLARRMRLDYCDPDDDDDGLGD